MPRTIIDLSAPSFQFNDEPLVHERIWQAANALAQAPMQRRKLQMEEEDRAQEREMRGLQMKKVQSDLDYEPTRRAQADEDRKRRITMEDAEIADKKAYRDYQMEHLRQQDELAKDKLAVEADKQPGGPAYTGPKTGRANPRTTQLMQMGKAANILPMGDEDDDSYAERVQRTLAMKHNTEPSVKESMILPGMLAENAKSLEPRGPEDVADEAARVSQASTPMARGGRALAQIQDQDPGAFKIPTLGEALNPTAPAAAAASAAPQPRDNSPQAEMQREIEFTRGRTPAEIKARMEVWKTHKPELWLALVNAARQHLGLPSYPNLENALMSEGPQRPTGMDIPGGDKVAQFAQSRY